MRLHIFVLIAAAGGTVLTATDRAPDFPDFAIRTHFSGKSVSPRVPNGAKEQRGYREVLDEAKKPPNFAGQYRLSQDTCGTDSRLIMVADRRTGKIHDLGCYYWTYRFGFHARPDLPFGAEFHLDSALLIVRGCDRESGDAQCGTHYFKVSPTGLVRIRFVKFELP